MKTMILSRLPPQQLRLIKSIGALASKHGFQVYLVGGIVRDLLLGRENLDLDIVVEGDGLGFARLLGAKLSSLTLFHHKFNTAALRLSDHSRIDIASCRKETYAHPGALPKVEPGTIEDDLKRRDFSINALAVCLNHERFGEMLDYCSGWEDLKKKRISVLHGSSFIDDPTRILRAVRFKERFNFSFSAHTLTLLKDALKADALSFVKPPRLWPEIVKLLKEDTVIRNILFIERLCKWRFLSPAVRIDAKTKKLLKAISREIEWFNRCLPGRRKLDVWLIYFFALLEHLTGGQQRLFCERFNLKAGDRKRIESIALFKRKKFLNAIEASHPSCSSIYGVLQPLSYEAILFFKARTNSVGAKRNLAFFFKTSNLKRLDVTGEDLKSMGFKSGRETGALLRRALCAKIDGEISGRQSQLDYLRRLIKRKS
ncbi:MAG: CCA tRNA nucleotidyltransferase [Candidatus Omnitrophota bacterium]